MREAPWKRWVWALAAGLALVNAGVTADVDGDGLSDEWESFYWDLSLRPNQDPDQDSLNNSEESQSQFLTDPFFADTDRDEFPENFDAAPISRSYIKFGEPRFTDSNHYEYAHTDWLLSVWKSDDGEWATNPVSWVVSATNTPGVGRLNMAVAREIMTNNLRVQVVYEAVPGAGLYVDLLEANGGTVVATNVCGNLMENRQGRVTEILAIPLAAFTNAAIVQLRGETGPASNAAVRVYEALVYIDEDGDGLDREQEVQLQTSDAQRDTDGDGLDDGDEVLRYHTNPLSVDTDGDHMADEWEVRHGLNPLSDDRTGDLDHDGTSNYTEYLQGRDPNAGVVADNGQVRLRLFMPLR